MQSHSVKAAHGGPGPTPIPASRLLRTGTGPMVGLGALSCGVGPKTYRQRHVGSSTPLLAHCDAKLARYRAIADAGGDPATVAGWIAEVTAQRAVAVSRTTTLTASHRPG